MGYTNLIIAFCLLPSLLSSQYRFSNYDIDDGLTENSITDIFEDSEGFIWFSTQDGLSQFDGHKFKNYNISYESTSLSDNFLWGIIEDSLGYIWCCSRNGLNRINKKSGHCTKFYLDIEKGIAGTNQIQDIVIFNDTLFASINRFVYRIPIRENYLKSTNKIEDLLVGAPRKMSALTFFKITNSKELLFINSKGLYNYLLQKTIPVPEFGTKGINNFLAIASDKNQNIIFTDGKQLYHLDVKSYLTKKLPYDFQGADIYAIESFEETVWVGTEKGIFILDNGIIKDQIKRYENETNGLASNNITALLKDRSGKIWIGSGGSGISLYNPRIDRFKYISQEVVGNKHHVRSVLQDKKDRLLIAGDKNFVLELKTGSFSQSLFAKEAVTSTNTFKTAAFKNLTITKLAQGFDDDILVGTKEGICFVLDENLKIKKKIDLGSSWTASTISDITTCAGKQIWVTTFHGVYSLNSKYEILQFFKQNEKGLTTNYFLSIYQDLNNDIWLGSNTGIFKYEFEQDNFEHFPYLKENPRQSPGFNFVCGFTDFNDGILWMSTFGGGLTMMNKREKTFKHFTTKNGLPSNVCNGLVSDQNGNIWISTNKGISKFNRTTKLFINYSKADGLLYNEFNLNAFSKNKYGDLLFGTAIGLVIFNPSQIELANHIPDLAITEIEINYQSSNDRLTDDGIELFPEDKAITFHYSDLNFSPSSKINFKYKLEGYNNDWIETSDLLANYTSLPDGNFIFYVNNTNEDGIWNTTPKSIPVQVHPPFYKAKWFMIICGTLFTLKSIFIIRYFSQRKIKKRLRELSLHREINREKQRISRDLHDNMVHRLLT